MTIRWSRFVRALKGDLWYSSLLFWLISCINFRRAHIFLLMVRQVKRLSVNHVTRFIIIPFIVFAAVTFLQFTLLNLWQLFVTWRFELAKRSSWFICTLKGDLWVSRLLFWLYSWVNFRTALIFTFMIGQVEGLLINYITRLIFISWNNIAAFALVRISLVNWFYWLQHRTSIYLDSCIRLTMLVEDGLTHFSDWV